MAPPIRTKTSIKEGYVLLAESSLWSSRAQSMKAAVKLYNVPYSTLYERVASTSYGEDYKPKNTRRITIKEEFTLRPLSSLSFLQGRRKFGQPLRFSDSAVQYNSDFTKRSGQWGHRDVHPERLRILLSDPAVCSVLNELDIRLQTSRQYKGPHQTMKTG